MSSLQESVAKATGIYSQVAQLLQIAQRSSADRSPGPMIAVVFSVMWLEGYTNYLFETIAWSVEVETPKMPPRVQALSDIGAELEKQRARLPEKIQLLSMTLRGRTFPRGSNPYQDFDLLLAIRNRLVHQRPSRLDVHKGLAAIDEPRKIRQGLIDRGLLDRGAVKMPYTIVLSKSEFGKWAYHTAYYMGRAIADCFPRGLWRRWAHQSNPLSPEHARMMRRSIPVSPRKADQ
jgi:hypothetical protein